jgi:hypothetical protein
VNQLIGNRWRRSHLKRADRDLVSAYVIWHGLPQPADPKEIPPRRVSLVVTTVRGRDPDPDNLMKSLLDSLVWARALRDDSARWCRLGPVTFERGKVLSTTIILEDLEPTED